MDAYDIHQEIFQAWQKLVQKADASSIKKSWQEVPVYATIDGSIVKVTGVTIEDGKIVLVSK